MANSVQVRVDTTPNPNSLKFTLDREVWSGRARTVASKDEAFGMPLAGALLDIAGVKSVFFLKDFITVNREPSAAWEPIAEAVIATIERHFADEP